LAALGYPRIAQLLDFLQKYFGNPIPAIPKSRYGEIYVVNQVHNSY